MQENFIQLHDRGARAANRLDEDTQAGFDRAVANNQVRLALEYAAILIKELKSEVSILKVGLASVLETPSEDLPEQPKVRRARKEEPKVESEDGS